MIMKPNRRTMPFNPKTHNLLQSIDLSVALEKAVDHLNNSDKDEPYIEIKTEKPFNLKMKFHQYIKAFKVQMKDEIEVDENKYDHLTFKEEVSGVLITSSLEKESLLLMTEEGDIL